MQRGGTVFPTVKPHSAPPYSSTPAAARRAAAGSTLCLMQPPHSNPRMTQDVYTDAQEHYVASVSDRVRGLFDTK